MAHRFHIEDLVLQDASGVVYRVVDTETRRPLTLRRFFPFGPGGKGLDDKQKENFLKALERIRGIDHPATSSLVCGGCDPVDGMPYLATEWVEGTPLPLVIEQKPFSSAAAIELVDRALEISEFVSQALGEEAVWVETELQTIVIGSGEGGRNATFCLAPPRTWLGEGSQRRSLRSIADLTENVMGWKGKLINAKAGNGLGGWVKWLRSSAKTATLQDAREKLAALRDTRQATEPAKLPPPATSVAAPTPTTRPPIAATAQKSPRKNPRLIYAPIALLTLGLAGWAIARKISEPQTAAQASEPAANIVNPADQSRLFSLNSQEVVLEGVFEEIAYSAKRNTMYLLFTKNASSTATRGAIVIKSAAADLNESSLSPLLGKKLRLSGKVRVEPVGQSRRPVVSIKSRSDIQIVE